MSGSGKTSLVCWHPVLAALMVMTQCCRHTADADTALHIFITRNEGSPQKSKRETEPKEAKAPKSHPSLNREAVKIRSA